MNSQLGAGFDPAVAPPRARARCAASAHEIKRFEVRVRIRFNIIKIINLFMKGKCIDNVDNADTADNAFC